MHFIDKTKLKGSLQLFTRKVGTKDWVLQVNKNNMIVDVGLNIVRDFLANQSPTPPLYFAIGSGTTAITSTDTALEQEVWRNAFISTDYTVSKKVTYEVFFSSVQGNGDDYISNVALFTTASSVLEDGEAVADWTAAADAAITADTTTYQNGSKSMKFALTFATGAGTGTKTTSIGNISAITGVSSGVPTQGRIRILVQCDDVTKLNGTNAIQYKIGSGAGDYSLFNLDDSVLVDDTWYIWDIDLTTASNTGTPVWTAADYQQLTVNCTANVNVYFDDLQVFGPSLFNAQTFTAFTKDKVTELLGYWTIEELNG